MAHYQLAGLSFLVINAVSSITAPGWGQGSVIKHFLRQERLCVLHKRMLETLSIWKSLCALHKRMLETLPRWKSLCIHHKRMFEALTRWEGFSQKRMLDSLLEGLRVHHK